MTSDEAKNTYQALRRRLLARVGIENNMAQDADGRTVYELLTHAYHLDTRNPKDRELQDLAQVLDDVVSAL